VIWVLGEREHRDAGGSRPQGSGSWGDGKIEMQVGHDLRDLGPGGAGTPRCRWVTTSGIWVLGEREHRDAGGSRPQ